MVDQGLAHSMHAVHDAPFGIDDYRVIQTGFIDQPGVFRDPPACGSVVITGEPEGFVEFPNFLERQKNWLQSRGQAKQPVDIPGEQPTF